MLAGVLHHLGVDMGTGLDVGVYYDPFEDRGLHRFNKQWADNVPSEKREQAARELGEYMRERIAEGKSKGVLVGGKYPSIVRYAGIKGWDDWPIKVIHVHRRIEDVIATTMKHYDGKSQQNPSKQNRSAYIGRTAYSLQKFHEQYPPEMLVEFDLLRIAPRDYNHKLCRTLGIEMPDFDRSAAIEGLVREPAWRCRDEIDDRMSKFVHQIWIGGSEVPHKLRGPTGSWSNDGHRLWDDTRLAHDFPECDEAVELAHELWDHRAGAMVWRGISDIYRVALLVKYGGLYCDMDCERVRDPWPELHELAKKHGKKIQVFDVRKEKNPALCNACLYAPSPQSPALIEYQRRQLEVLREEVRIQRSGERHGKRPTLVTGPTLLHIMATERPDDFVVPDPKFLRNPEYRDEQTSVVIHQKWRF